MPLYEFVCNECSRRFDTLVRSFDATADVTCRECESPDVRRLMSTFAMSGGFDDQFVAGESTVGTGGGCCGGNCGCGH